MHRDRRLDLVNDAVHRRIPRAFDKPTATAAAHRPNARRCATRGMLIAFPLAHALGPEPAKIHRMIEPTANTANLPVGDGDLDAATDRAKTARRCGPPNIPGAGVKAAGKARELAWLHPHTASLDLQEGCSHGCGAVPTPASSTSVHARIGGTARRM